MSMKRSRPGSPTVRKGAAVGPDYPEENFRNPYNAGIDRQYDEGDEKKSLVSPTAITIEGAGLPMHDKYNDYWEGR